MRTDPRFAQIIVRSLAVFAFTAIVVSFAIALADESGSDAPRLAGAREHTGEPSAFHGRGRLVCLAEEMKRLYKADVDPVHEHLLGFRTDTVAGDEPAIPRFLALLRTPQSEALFADERFGTRTLILTGRVFPATSLLEVSGVEWIHDGKIFAPYYWCEVCSIRGVDPGPCACCQGPVVLREDETGPDRPERP